MLSSRIDVAVTAPALRPAFACALPFIALFAVSVLIPERPLRGTARRDLRETDPLASDL